MGRSKTDASHSHRQEIHQSPAAVIDKKPPPRVHSFPPPQSFPPDDVEPESFPPRQQSFPQKQDNNINIQAQQISINQQDIAMAIAAQQNMLQNQPWKNHLCGCMSNPTNAIITLCCPCITFGQIAEVLDEGSTSCATNGMWYTLLAICIAMPCLMSCGYRSKLRAKFGLVESPAPDCIVHCFCEYCALCQEYRELYVKGFDPSIENNIYVDAKYDTLLDEVRLLRRSQEEKQYAPVNTVSQPTKEESYFIQQRNYMENPRQGYPAGNLLYNPNNRNHPNFSWGNPDNALQPSAYEGPVAQAQAPRAQPESTISDGLKDILKELTSLRTELTAVNW